jgi:hypothetical protein
MATDAEKRTDPNQSFWGGLWGIFGKFIDDIRNLPVKDRVLVYCVVFIGFLLFLSMVVMRDYFLSLGLMGLLAFMIILFFLERFLMALRAPASPVRVLDKTELRTLAVKIQFLETQTRDILTGPQGEKQFYRLFPLLFAFEGAGAGGLISRFTKNPADATDRVLQKLTDLFGN